MGLGINPLDKLGDVAKSVGGALGDGAEAFGGALDSARKAVGEMSPSDIGHTALDGLGMVPVVGEVADLANGAWYAGEGDWANAALSAGAAIPFIGNAATGAKWVKRGAEAADAISDGAKALDKAKDGARLAEDAADAGKAGKAEAKAADGPDAPKKGDEPNGKTPELTMISRTQGANRMEWNVDGEGRFVSGKAHLSEDFAGRKTRGSDETRAQKEAASRGVDGDQGGHMFAHRFVKDQGSINLVPQNGDLNNRAWGQMEQEWGDWIKSGREIDVSITASPAGKDRPDRFRVKYEVMDPETGKVVYKNSKPFENEAGQTFDRVPGKQMGTWGS